MSSALFRNGSGSAVPREPGQAPNLVGEIGKIQNTVKAQDSVIITATVV